MLLFCPRDGSMTLGRLTSVLVCSNKNTLYNVLRYLIKPMKSCGNKEDQIQSGDKSDFALISCENAKSY